MSFPTPIGVIPCPLTHSIFCETFDFNIVIPGNPKAITTETFIEITTETGTILRTET